MAREAFSWCNPGEKAFRVFFRSNLRCQIQNDDILKQELVSAEPMMRFGHHRLLRAQIARNRGCHTEFAQSAVFITAAK